MKPTPRSSHRTWLQPVLLGLVPLLLLLCGVRSLPSEHAVQKPGQRQIYPVPKFRTVVLVLDSVGVPMASDPELMPFVSSLRTTSLFGEAVSCPGKATFPCVKSIFEGRTATTGTTLQDFSAVASNRTTWPKSLAALGLRLVLTSDHTLNRLYPDAFVDALNYETLHVPFLDRDGFAYRAADKWLKDPSIDVLLLHIIGTDKVAHDYPVGGDVYRAKYLEVDNFVREVAARLTPQDYLYVISDHGHNALGGHTEDAVYFAQGPIFPEGRNVNLRAADLLFLLSAPYGLAMPEGYEGHLLTGLTLLRPEQREKLLREQARLWSIPTEGASTDSLEARLNDHVILDRQTDRREQGIAIAWRTGPWLLAAALFLLSQLTRAAESQFNLAAALTGGVGVALGLCGVAPGGWIVVAAALWICLKQLGVARTGGALGILGLLAVAAFWLTPSGLRWFHESSHQPIGWAVFYPLALLAGFAFTRAVGATTWQVHSARVLWIVGLAIWLLAYFGPYNYALTGAGPKVVLCIIAPLAIILRGGVRSLFSRPLLLLLLGMIPFINFHTSSFNVEYRLTDRIAELPMMLGLLLCAAAGGIGAIALYSNEARERGWQARQACLLMGAMLGWLAGSVFFFGFDAGKILGALLAGIWLLGLTALFRRAELSSAWSALAGVIVLFAAFHFVLNGFALSHVDFRFAANTIIPFQQEAWRAPQLIAWAVVKYLFVLLPPLTVLLLNVRRDAALQLLQLGCWRELMIVLSAIGLSIFDPRGVNELCSEEIYFWTFLNFALWLLCLASLWFNRSSGDECQAEPPVLAASA